MRERPAPDPRPVIPAAGPVLPFFSLSLVLAAALLALPGLSSATDVGGAITGNTTWTLAGSPYVATSTLSVQNGATLTIEPGVTVKFAPGAMLEIGSGSNGGGTVIADAAAGEPIVFTSAQPSPAPGDWLGFKSFANMVRPQYSGGAYVSGTVFRNCVLEYAGGASVTAVFNFILACPAFIDCVFRRSLATTYIMYGSTSAGDSLVLTRCTFSDDNAGAGNVLTTSNAHLDHCRLTGNSGNSVLVSTGGTCVIDNTVISDNAGANVGIQMNISGRMILRCSVVSRNGKSGGIGGFYINSNSGACSLDVSQSIIQNNTPRSVLVYGNTHVINMTGNWWGTTDTTAIHASMYDCKINSSRSCVWFVPVLDTPTTCALTPVRPTTWGKLRRTYR